ncbi:serine/threonine-protein phosphatase [Ktedonosporobacter rubrisoli]|uniref:Serine/threonine-protein phosphatase n=1 Tax=Ktedonosporobacter rubrisoli TaxID=2509675 RepID=A0A4P6K218_KTERU|nr:PP2C family serine/threonine-protein phosphatase [Ktedonosporobacter rubrisoli]QBD82228.1 serine/threonine-protein phosphatase [Ktedonosporobacter rubrisoli]
MPQHRMSRRTHITTHNHIIGLPHFTFAHRSIACERHPERNEDSILVDELRGLAAVFDGVGGSAAGEIASQTAARAARQRWQDILEQHHIGHKMQPYLESCNDLDLCDALQQLVLEADEQVRTEGAHKAGTDDLATTVALAAFSRQPDARDYTMVYAHVGDSRIYLLRGDEPLQRLTSDDGLLAKLVENQIINEEDALRIDQAVRTDELSDTEFSYFRLRGGITQALGGPLPPTIHIDTISIHPGDRILLCTDGIHDNLTDQEIEETLRSEPRHASARVLVERSIQRSHQERSITVRAKPDDMSAIVITCRF